MWNALYSRLLILSLAALPVLWSQQPPPPPDGGPDAPLQETEHPRRGPGGPFGRTDHLLNELKEQDPETFEQLMTLRETDPEAFREAIRKHLQERAGERGGPPEHRWKGSVVGQALERLREEEPEKYAELEALREQDPPAFRRQMRELLAGKARDFYHRQGGIDLRERERALRQLAKRYHDTTDAATKAELEHELREQLEATFDAMIEAQEVRIQQIEKELQQMEEKLQQRRALRDRIVEKRLQDLLGNNTGKNRGHRQQGRPE